MEHKPSVINSIIGYGTTYNGNIEAIDLLRIDGNFSGHAKCHDSILIGLEGKAKGVLSASKIIITGMFQGEIRKAGLLIAQSTAIIIGNIETDLIIVESGSVICADFRTIVHTGERPFQLTRESLENESGESSGLRIVGRVNSKMLEKMFV